MTDLLGAEERGGPKLSRSQGTKATVLLTRQGPIQFELSETSYGANIDWDVRDFVKHPKQRELRVRHDTRLTVVGFAAFLLVGAVLLLWLGFRKAPLTMVRAERVDRA